MANEPSEETPSLVDRGQASELFIDGFHGISITNGAAKLNLFSTRLNATTSETERVIVCYLTMALPTLISVHGALGNVLRELEQKGIIAQEVHTDEKA